MVFINSYMESCNKETKRYQDLSLYHSSKDIRGKNKYYIQLWWIVYALFFKPSPRFMFGWRNFLLRSFGAKIGKNVLIRSTAFISYPWNVTIGDSCWIGEHNYIYGSGKITLGNNVALGPYVKICSGQHDITKITFDTIAKDVVIEDEVWLAADVFVAAGVIIKKGTVVGARSSVFKTLEEGKICIGTPAVPIKDRITNYSQFAQGGGK